MKKLFFLILPLILLGCGEDNSNDKVLSPLTPASVINVYPASYDFGTVKAGETKKTTSFTVNTDGFVTSRCNVESDILGLNIDDANILPKCSSENPVITVTSSPKNIIKTGEIKELGTQKYIDFDTAGTNNITITAVSDTYLSGGYSSTSTGGTFNSTVTRWELKDNKVSAKAEIIFNPVLCSGPASDRIIVNGLDGTSKYTYLYITRTGTAADGTACSNRYPLQTN